MNRICEINIIVFCAFVLFINNSVIEVYSKKDNIRSFNLLKELKNLRFGILPGNWI